MFSKPTATINLGNLQHNLSVVRSLAPSRKILAVVKANAYGHGVHEIANALMAADGYAVARFDEAIELRQSQLTKPLLVLGGIYTNIELDSCLQHNIDIVIHQSEQLELLCKHKTTRHAKINAWIKIDSGMHRLGISPADFTIFFQKISALPYINRLVAMTHFASADEPENPFTKHQLEIFTSAIRNHSNIETSLANSASIINWKTIHGDWVRPGLMLYGINPGPDSAINLKPVMTLDAPIIAIRKIAANETVGYNQTWQARRNSIIATTCMGYGDGYPTQIKPGTPVLVNGVRIPVIGRVSMDLVTLDITDHPQVSTGDRVVLWGEDSTGNILHVEEIARQAGTIPYDLVTGISGRVKYSYIRQD